MTEEPFLQDWEDGYTRNLVWTASAAIRNLDHVKPEKGLPGLVACLKADYPALLEKLKKELMDG